MKQAWIEDFLALVEAGTFSRAALLRNVTQPAFSRRIQLLETWLGVELIDRRAQPLRLTPVAERYIPDFRALLHNIRQVRSRMQSENSGMARVILATQHSLTITRLPSLLAHITQNPKAQLDFSVYAENRDECVTMFMRDQVDLLLCMEEGDEPLSNLMPDAGRLHVGSETLVPISAMGQDGMPLHRPQSTTVLKLLSYPPDSFLGRIMYKHCLGALLRRQRIETIHESVFLAGVKEMVLAGLGMAWLPESLIQRELQAGSLVVVQDGLESVTLELGLYRNPRATHPAALDRIWALLADTHP